MQNLLFLPALLVIVLIQTTILNHLKVFGVQPDLLIGLVVVVSVCRDWKWALPIAIIAGLFKDLFGTPGIGINIFMLPLWSYLLSKLSRKISIDDSIGLSAATFLTVILNDISSRLLYLYLGKYVSFGIFLRITIIESLYTTLAVFIFLSLALRLRFKKICLTA